ncbi:hypothetical protein K1719_028819 [Acacia pycnantha]|nr:hypothetical protein K1719_028819 [Acacia pycnantha]
MIDQLASVRISISILATFLGPIFKTTRRPSGVLLLVVNMRLHLMLVVETMMFLVFVLIASAGMCTRRLTVL